MSSCADLIQLLQRPSSSPSEQQAAAAALAALPMTPQIWSIAVGALPRLVELMQHSDNTEGVRDQAKRALHHITDCAGLIPANQVQAASAGDLSSLVQLLHGDIGFVQSGVLCTLGALAAHAYNRSQIVGAGAMGRIVQLLRSSTQEVPLSAATALWSMSTEPKALSVLLSVEGAIASLARLLKSSSVKVQRAAVSAFFNITISADGTAAVVAAGAIPPIVLLLKSKAAPVQEMAARTLSHLGQDEANQASIAAAGAIPPLVLMLKSGSEDVRGSAAAALCNLTIRGALQARAVAAGAVVPLSHLLKSRSAEVRDCALRALSNLSHCPDSHPQIFAAGAIDSVIPFLEAAPSTVTHVAALMLLGNLTTIDACHTTLFAAGVIPHFVGALSCDSVQLQRLATRALGSLAYKGESCGLRIVAAGAIEPLVPLLDSADELLQMSAVTTLGNLVLTCNSCSDTRADLASSIAAVGPLVRLLLRCKSEAAQEHVVRVLLALSARSDSHARAIAAADGIPPLVQCLHSGSAQTRLMVVSLLTLVVDEGTLADLVAMETAGALPILVKLQGASSNGSEMKAITTELLDILKSFVPNGYTGSGSSRSTIPGSILPPVSGSTSEGDKSRTASNPSIPSSSSPSAPSAPPPSVIPPSSEATCTPPPASMEREKEKVCWCCGAAGVPLKKCSVCTVAAYCGAACQKADWKAHKGQCAGLKASAAASTDPTDVDA